jgi:tetratricopeptide (TPR) repeat protein/tRNA A-37 threonylcarbamoyl transferase component Bud32
VTHSPGLDVDRHTPPAIPKDGRSPTAPRPSPTKVIDSLEIHSTEPNVPPPTLPDLPGYRMEGLLGGGGMGVVYRAVDLTLGRRVALKMIAAEHDGPLAGERFRTEARTVARLRHSNIVQIYEVGEHAGRPFLALEYVDGGSLADRLAAHGPLPARDAAQLVATLARAMQHAHAQGIVHRDLKPHNVLLAGAYETGEAGPESPAGAPKITDFGLAKLLDADHGRTRSGVVLGTPAYMAPEQARGNGRGVTPSADVYALGAILFECLTGRPPFDGETSWDVLRQVIAEDAPPPSRYQPRLARDLDTICLKCLQKDPTRRYASAAALAEDLERFAAGEAIAARPDGLVRKLGRKLRRRPLAVALVLLLTGTATLGGGFWQLRRSQAESALHRGRELTQRGDHLAAAECFADARDRLGRLPACEGLRAELFRSWAAAELHGKAHLFMVNADPEHLSPDGRRRLAESCRRLWDEREQILQHADRGDPAWEGQVRAGLRDIALRGFEFRGWPADEARRFVDELEAFGAPSPLISLERAVLDGRSIPPPNLEAPQSAVELHLLGRSYQRIGHRVEAESCFRAGLRKDPHAPGLYFDLATLAYHGRRYDVALTQYTACLAITHDAAVLSRRGFAHLALGHSEEAMHDFDDALETKDTDVKGEAHFGRGQLYQKAGRMVNARDEYQAALERGYPRERVLYPLAVALLELGAPDDARRRLQQLLTLRPGDRDALAMTDELDRRTRPRNP